MLSRRHSRPGPPPGDVPPSASRSDGLWPVLGVVSRGSVNRSRPARSRAGVPRLSLLSAPSSVPRLSTRPPSLSPAPPRLPGSLSRLPADPAPSPVPVTPRSALRPQNCRQNTNTVTLTLSRLGAARGLTSLSLPAPSSVRPPGPWPGAPWQVPRPARSPPPRTPPLSLFPLPRRPPPSATVPRRGPQAAPPGRLAHGPRIPHRDRFPEDQGRGRPVGGPLWPQAAEPGARHGWCRPSVASL